MMNKLYLLKSNKRILFLTLIFTISTWCFSQSKKELELRAQFWKENVNNIINSEIPTEWKNESAIILKDDRYIQYINSGKNVFSTIRKHQLIKIQDQSSLEDFSEIKLDKDSKISFVWTTFLKEETIISIRIIKPNGDISIVDVEKEGVEEDNIRKIAIPNLEIGDILDIIIQVNKKEKEFYGLSVYPAVENTLKDDYPILSYRLAVEVENDFFLNMNTYNGAPQIKEEKTDRKATKRYVVEAQNIEKLETTRWYYPLVEEPSVKFQIAFARKSQNEYYADIFKGEDGERKATVTKKDILDYYKRKFKKVKKKTVQSAIKHIKEGNFKSPAEKLRAAIEYIRFHRYTKYFEPYFAYRADIIEGTPKQRCSEFFYGIYENDSQVVRDLRAICDEFDIDYDVVMVQPRYDGKLKDLLIKNNARIGLKFNTNPNLYFFDFNENMSLERFPSILENAETYVGSVKKRKNISEVVTSRLTSSSYQENLYQEKIDLKLNDTKKGFIVEREKIASGHFEDQYIFNWIHFKDILAEDYKKYPETDHYYNCGSKKQIKINTQRYKDFETKRYEDFEKQLEKAIDKEWENAEAKNYSTEVIETGRYDVNKPVIVKEAFTLEDGYIKKAGKNLIIEIGKFIGGQVDIEEDERNRNVDIYLDYAKTYNYEIRFEVPSGYTVKGIKDLNINIENETGGFISKASLEDNVLVIKTTKMYKSNFIENSKWQMMLPWLDAALKFSDAKILLQK